jgi:hypothetical protein
MSLKRRLLFYSIAALVLLLIVGHQDSRADMREQINDADFCRLEDAGRAERRIMPLRRELGPRRGA